MLQTEISIRKSNQFFQSIWKSKFDQLVTKFVGIKNILNAVEFINSNRLK